MKTHHFGRYDLASFLTFIAYACCAMAIPMTMVPLATDMGFPLAEGGMGAGGALQIGRTTMMVLAMICCGFAAGRWGNRRTLGFSLLFLTTGITLVSIAPVYGLVFIGVAVSGVGEGVVEGLVTPFVQDLHPHQPGRYLNLAHSFWSVGTIIVVLGAGLALTLGVSWRTVVFVAGLVALIPALILLLPSRHSAKVDKGERHTLKEVAGHAIDIMKKRKFWLFFLTMVFCGGGEFCLTFWCASLIQLEFGGTAWAAGAGTACFAGGMFLGRFLSGLLVAQENLKKLIIGMAAAAMFVTLWFPFVTSLYMLCALLLLAGFATGPFWPSVQSNGATRVKGNMTMTMILFSCAGVPGSGLFAVLIGILGDAVGLRWSFFIVPACFAAVLALMLWDYAAERREQRRNEGSTRIIQRPLDDSAKTPSVRVL